MSGAHLFWCPFLRCLFVLVPVCPVPICSEVEFRSHSYYQLNAALKEPSTLPTPNTCCIPPEARPFKEDETGSFLKADTISNFDELNYSRFLLGFQTYETEKIALFITILFMMKTPAFLRSKK